MEQPSGHPILKSESDASEVHRGERVDTRLSLRTGGSSWSAISSSETPFRKRHLVLEEVLGENPMPIFGSISIQGLADRMEDTVVVQESFCDQTDIAGGKPLHFFAVYDGHGGSHVSTLCKNLMHQIIAEELKNMWCTRGSKDEWADLVRAAIEKSFFRMDYVALNLCICGKKGPYCRYCCKPQEYAMVGSTAAVAILTPNRIVVANCGDSRAVLCRAGKPIPLSVDHKPNRPEELVRIKNAGGHIVYRDGFRVNGILDMSRSLGDLFLKTIITSKPSTSITKRDPEDECLIIATDGIWDAISNDLACQVVRTCLKEESPATALRSPSSSHAMSGDDTNVLFPSKSAFAATILCRLALGRGSTQNISAIVVDLMGH
ncbi:probable protein phosphatase 2C 75 [Quercus robur]|uniref:probable protein phosphatase 2C 75 n=1 Tax=Quercus robur TaxID=38942 RepID=UPI0021620D1D|nr:probable protein phosphatase 2C 75 [Quercus robur]